MRKRLLAYENVNTAGRATRIRSPACRNRLVGVAVPGGGVGPVGVVTLRGVELLPAVLVVGGVGPPVLLGGEVRRRPSRITTTCAGIVGIGM